MSISPVKNEPFIAKEINSDPQNEFKFKSSLFPNNEKPGIKQPISDFNKTSKLQVLESPEIKRFISDIKVRERRSKFVEEVLEKVEKKLEPNGDPDKDIREAIHELLALRCAPPDQEGPEAVFILTAAIKMQEETVSECIRTNPYSKIFCEQFVLNSYEMELTKESGFEKVVPFLKQKLWDYKNCLEKTSLTSLKFFRKLAPYFIIGGLAITGYGVIEYSVNKGDDPSAPKALVIKVVSGLALSALGLLGKSLCCCKKKLQLMK